MSFVKLKIVLFIWYLASMTDLSKGQVGLIEAEQPCTGSQYQFKCENGKCIDNLRECDAVPDCADGSDERRCNIVPCDSETMYRCTQGECIAKEMVCDKAIDCDGGDDEGFCRKEDKCDSSRFRCDNGHCIPINWHCNGVKECGDGSDERNCTKRTHECSDHQFTCTDLFCIEKGFHCDGTKDCMGGEDELGCKNLNDCILDNGHFPCKDQTKCVNRTNLCDGIKDCKDGSDEGGECDKNCTSICQEDCMKTPRGPQCLCDIGFKLSDNNRTCEDINECEGTKLHCDHFCTNTEGTAMCSCAEGYQLLSDKATCRTEAPAMLLFTVGPKVVAKLLGHMKSWIIWSGDDEAIGVSFDPVDNFAYWVVGNKILMKKIDVNGQPKLFVDQGFKKPENIAIDWLGRNVYISDHQANHIIACNINNFHCTPVLRNLSHPRAIQLDLLNRYIYWTDVDSHKIERADLDGNNKVSLIKENIVWPNGLALDYPASRIYWADARLDHIQTSDMQGKDIKTLPESEMGHVFSLVVWQDRLYWTDWYEGHNTEIHSCRKRDGKEGHIEYKDESYQITNLAIYHESMLSKKMENPCQQSVKNGKCSHLCFLSKTSKRGFVCACPEEMKLAKNELDCYEKDKSKPLIAVESKLYTYEIRKFGVNTLMPKRFEGFELKTASGMDYNPLKQIVYISDTQKGEITALNLYNRTVKVVLDNILQPIDIAVDWLRDNIYWINGVHGNVDVARISERYRRTLISNMKTPSSLTLDVVEGMLFASDSGSYPSIVKCELDGSLCQVLADEHISSPSSIYLDSSVKPKRLYWADSRLGIIDSIQVDGAFRKTELYGLYAPMKIVVNDYIMWTESRSPKLMLALKTNTSDIKDLLLDIQNSYGHDANFKGEWSMNLVMVEGHVNSPEINPCFGLQRCHHLCFSKNDSVKMCGCAHGLVLQNDNSTCSVSDCEPNERQCDDGECVSKSYWCDNSFDCDDGSDEKNCSHLHNCSAKEFRCKNGFCKKLTDVCDGIDDCTDGSDEDPEICKIRNKECDYERDWKCNTSGECIPRKWRCNGKPDCNDTSDELRCEAAVCSKSQKRCDSGWCVELSWWCDGEEDCLNGEDETSCPCKLGEFKCNNGTCLDERQMCLGEIRCDDDSVPDCVKYEKVNAIVGFTKNRVTGEKECPLNWRPCLTVTVPTDNLTCVPRNAWCNGTGECPGREDEIDCKKCDEHFVKCAENSACIPVQWRCDRFKDCPFGSDEAGCQFESYTESIIPTCGPMEYECSAGKCIPITKVCDGSKDCLYGVDESENCNDCEHNNGGCEQICIKDPVKPICGCVSGYRLQDDNVTCSDIDECDEVDICHHNCLNVKGTYKCSCDRGYSLVEDGISCKLTNSQKWSIVTIDDSSVTFLEDNLKTFEKLSNNKSFEHTASEFIYNPEYQNLIAVSGNGEIYTINEGKWTMIFQNFSKLTASDLDFINDNLYLAEANIHKRASRGTSHKESVITTVKICSLKNRICGILFASLVNTEIPSMKVSPALGMMFTCENLVTENTSQIVSRKLDGSSEDIIANEKVLQCDSIALDEIKKRVYWVDSKLNRIESVDILGHERLLFDSNEIHRPRGLLIINHSLLWFNSETGMLVKCLIHIPNNCQESFHESSLSVVDFKQKYDKLIPTPCKDNTCPDICVPSTLDVPHCTCAVGYIYENRSCIEIKSSNNKAVSGSCLKNNCGSGTCHTDNLGFVSCFCPPGLHGSFCELRFPEDEGGNGGVVAAAVIIILILLALACLLCFYKRESLKKIKDGSFAARFKLNSGNSFSRMVDDPSSPIMPPTTPRLNSLRSRDELPENEIVDTDLSSGESRAVISGQLVPPGAVPSISSIITQAEINWQPPPTRQRKDNLS